jgi:ABC-type antimicrobial peptide transport system permease subunit
VRTAGDPESTAGAVRKAVASLDPQMPFYSVHTMQELLDQSLVSRRVPMLLAAAFAVVALFLAAIGIYGVLAYSVAQRRREIGIRLALGSTASEVFRLVVRDGVKIVGFGLVFGVLGLVAVRELLRKVLYGVQPMDPATIAIVAAGLVLVALVATIVPARRASKVSPATALLP